MNSLVTIDSINDVPMWTRYRSLKHGKPFNKNQAYSTVFDWIEYDGIYFHRSLELGLSFFINGVLPPDFLSIDYNTVLFIIDKFNNGAVSVANLAMLAPTISNEKRLNYLKKYQSVCIVGIPTFDVTGWKSKIYTDCFSIGGDVIIDAIDCIKLSVIMPVICKQTLFEDNKFNAINWDNTWVLD